MIHHTTGIILYIKLYKALYCKHETELMLEKLQKDPPKVLQPTREEMMNMMNMKS